MNQSFVAVIKTIIAEQGEAVLGDAARLKGFVADYASRESRAERIAFGRCIEYNAYTELRNAEDREAAKADIARRVNANEGIDMALCNDALDALEAALFGEAKPQKALCLKCGRELEDGQTECPFCGWDHSNSFDDHSPPGQTENAAPQPEPPPQSEAPKNPAPATVPQASNPIPRNTSHTQRQAPGTRQAAKKRKSNVSTVIFVLVAIVIFLVIYFSQQNNRNASYYNPAPATGGTTRAQEQAAPARDSNGLRPSDYDKNGWAQKDGKWVANPAGARYSAPPVTTNPTGARSSTPPVTTVQPRVRIVNNTGYSVYFVYITANTDQSWGNDKLGSSTFPYGNSVLFDLPSSSTNRYDIMLEDLDGDTYTKWNIPISNNQTVTFTIGDMDID
jgi:hypothetical protein